MELRKLFTNDIEMLELISDFDVNSVIEKIIFVLENDAANLKVEDVKKITFNEDNESVELFLEEGFDFGIKFVIKEINKNIASLLNLEIVSLNNKTEKKLIKKIFKTYSTVEKNKEEVRSAEYRLKMFMQKYNYKKVSGFRVIRNMGTTIKVEFEGMNTFFLSDQFVFKN